MQIKGIKRGNVIELLEEVEIPDDTEIPIEVQETSPTSDEERWEKMKAFLESDRPGRKELVNILNEIDREERWEKMKAFLEPPKTKEEIEEWRKIGEQLEKERQENRIKLKA